MFSTTIPLLLLAVMMASTLALSPLNLGLWILMTAFLTAILFSTTLSSWFSLLLFLIYIGGMLVIFAYFIAISPNQEIHLSPLISLSLILYSSFMYIPPTTLHFFYSSSLNKMILDFSPLYSGFAPALLMTLAIALFLALILVVKLSIRTSGPLRPFLYVLPPSKQSPPN